MFKSIVFLLALFLSSCIFVVDNNCIDDYDCSYDEICYVGECRSSVYFESGYVTMDCGCYGEMPYDLLENFLCDSYWEVAFTCYDICYNGYTPWGLECW